MSRNGSRISMGAGLIALMVLTVACAPEASSESPSAGTDMAVASAVADAPTMTVYKSPTCGCCASWVEHMERAGFRVEVRDTEEMGAVKAEAGVPMRLTSCHTAMVGDYVFEGHIPADVIARFLTEAPQARGLAVPGMPVGSPGMEMGDQVDRYDVVMFDQYGGSTIYESR